MKRSLSIGLVSLFAMALISGCGLTSTPTALTSQIVARTVDPNGLSQVESALLGVSNDHSYQVKAGMTVAAGHYLRRISYYGYVSLPGFVSMDETIGGVDYQIYQMNNFAYAKTGGKWSPIQPITDLTPWTSMLALLHSHPPRVVYTLPQQTLVSWPCYVYQFRANDLNTSLTKLGAKGKLIAHQALYTVYVDVKDGKLRQIQVQSTVGVPGLGTASLESTELLFNYNKIVPMSAPSDLMTQIELP
ncbi:hypothetical protein [Ferroacidibacillus organovorans]|uniref:Uncharacterized protein n=1 Tax=Ferroacidibacillus organovorans TaxID=1765683 RepID=A0A161PX13_9BACL|nr:hypothetical protein [Ferroacidibacillus organovorans]KYP82132.1 hypothetical protein AYJ22_00310 [Ferroacidibacillus organovorans]OAG94415.1 hypothetical protein AYW79_05200 [Ferroacidibacillus organovorans]OPG15699.1 hypothetical protein B2M26_11650 [Ferroacidibacillus organovorans]